MNINRLEEAVPKFYGSVTVSERGQVVIPVEARKEFGLEPSTKLLVFGGPHRGGLVLAKAEFVTEFLAKAMPRIAQLEEVLRTDTKPPSPTD